MNTANTLTKQDRWWIALTLGGILSAVTSYLLGGRLPVENAPLFIFSAFIGTWLLIFQGYCTACSQHETLFIRFLGSIALSPWLFTLFMSVFSTQIVSALFQLSIGMVMAGMGYIVLNLIRERQ